MANYSFRDIVIDSRTGLNPRQNFKLGNSNNYYITIKDIHNGRIEITDKTDRIDDEAVAKIKKRSRIKNGDILFTSLGRICETAIVHDKNDTWEVNESIFIFTINSEIIDAEYFCILLQSTELQERLAKDSSGSTFKSIKMNQLEKLSFDLPTIAEQRKIAININKVSNLINLCNAILEKLDLLVKSRFIELFGDPVSNPKKWDIKPLLSIGECKNGMNFHYDDNGVEIHCLGVGDFKDLSIITDTTILPKISLNEMPSDEYLLQNDDIVFVRSNGNKALVGRSLAIYPNDTSTTFSGFCIRFRKDDDSIIVPYLLRVLKTVSIRKKMAGRGANIQNLNQQILSTLEIPIPPLALQEQFAAFVEQTDKSKLAVKQVLEKAETLKKALMQEYFG